MSQVLVLEDAPASRGLDIFEILRNLDLLNTWGLLEDLEGWLGKTVQLRGGTFAGGSIYYRVAISSLVLNGIPNVT